MLIRDKEVFRRTVRTFAEIKGKPLNIVFGAFKKPFLLPGRVMMPDRHAPPLILSENDAYTQLEHLLAHFLFDTDYEKAYAAAHALARRIPELGDKIVPLYLFIWSLVEDERVESLWTKIYAGSAVRFNEIKKRLMAGVARNPIEAVLAARANSCGEEVADPGKWRDVYEEAAKSFETVRCAGPDVAIHEAARLTLYVAIKEVDEFGVAWVGGSTIREVFARGGELSDEAFNLAYYDRLRAIKRQPPNIDPTRELSAEEVEESRRRMLELVDRIRKLLVESTGRGAAGRPRRRRAFPFFEDEATSKYGSVRIVSESRRRAPPRDSVVLARTIATKLRNVADKYTRVLDVEGVRIDMNAYVSWRIMENEDPEIFEVEESVRGTHVVILLDGSDSMLASGAFEVARKVSTALALASSQLPNVTFEAVLFGGHHSKNESVIVRANTPESVAALSPVENYPLTPIHVALAYARHSAPPMVRNFLVFLVSDGEPVVSSRRGRPLQWTELVKMVSEEAAALRARRARLFTALVRPRITAPDIRKMYGPPSCWAIIDEVGEIKDFVVRRFVAKLSQFFRKAS